MILIICKCKRCGHEWAPRNKKETPIICPKCKSPYWNKPYIRADKVKENRRQTMKPKQNIRAINEKDKALTDKHKENMQKTNSKAREQDRKEKARLKRLGKK